MNPKILLCDEPTSGLDVATIVDVVELLQSVRDMGITMIIASHNLDFLTKISDRIILLKNGKIIVDINPKEIDEPTNYLKIIIKEITHIILRAIQILASKLHNIHYG
ncbi:amino acid ABC transporter, ATP-binding protein, partial [Wolbachia endosymbiont of Drosophila ananassae]